MTETRFLFKICQKNQVISFLCSNQAFYWYLLSNTGTSTFVLINPYHRTMETPTFSPPTPAEIEQYKRWWASLSDPWKQAFNEIMLNRSSIDELPLVTLHQVWNAPALRFAGPKAPYPNTSLELDNLDGVLALKKWKS